MRDIFEELFRNEPLDPTEAARRGTRPQLRGRFYEQVGVAEGEGGFGLTLDGRPVKTPPRRRFRLPKPWRKNGARSASTSTHPPCR
jgi:chaperone required for assembly of F1-ATPase